MGGQGGKAGEGGKGENDKRPRHAALAEHTHHGVSHPRPETAQQAHRSWQEREVRPAGLDDQQRPRKGRQHRAHLERSQALAQHQDPQQNGEEGGELVQHGGVGQKEMVDGVKIAQHAHGAESGPQKQIPPIAAVQIQCGAAARQHHGGSSHRDQVAEKAFLHRGKIPGKPHEQAHERKEKGGCDDVKDPFVFGVQK